MNLKSVGDEMKDGEEISIVPKDLGSSEVYAQEIKFSPNGWFITLCSDSDYVVNAIHKFTN